MSEDAVRLEQPTAEEAWEAALDDMELTLDIAERLLRGHNPDIAVLAAPWDIPDVSGPMPKSMQRRARKLLRRQSALIEETAQAAALSRQQIALLAKVADAGRRHLRDRPAYVDVSI
ncbi:MAG TPA: hypothetical protein VFT75_15630 [Nocardioidaceae bacterium]|nr:hypothetical protein [Nocardioidaceae bacterium]